MKREACSEINEEMTASSSIQPEKAEETIEIYMEELKRREKAEKRNRENTMKANQKPTEMLFMQ